jgi:hypothetical protein
MAIVTALIIMKPVVLIQVIAVQHLVLILQQMIAQIMQRVVTQLVLMVHVVELVILVQIQMTLNHLIVKLLMAAVTVVVAVMVM